MINDGFDYVDLAKQVARTYMKHVGCRGLHYYERYYDDALMAALEARSRWDPARGPLAAFLYTKAYFGIIDGIRSNGPITRTQHRRGERAHPVQVPMSLDAITDTGLSPQLPDEAAVDAFGAAESYVDAVRLVEPLLDGLSPRWRDVIERIYLLNQSQRDVAGVYGVSESRISQMKTRALRQMRETAESLAA